MSEELKFVPRERWGTMHPVMGPFNRGGLVTVKCANGWIFTNPASAFDWKYHSFIYAAIPPGSTAEWADDVQVDEPVVNDAAVAEPDDSEAVSAIKAETQRLKQELDAANQKNADTNKAKRRAIATRSVLRKTAGLIETLAFQDQKIDRLRRKLKKWKRARAKTQKQLRDAIKRAMDDADELLSAFEKGDGE